MRLENVFMSVDLAIGSYRRAVGTVLPAHDQSCLANQETGNPERRPQRYAQDLPLQSIPFQLRKELGIYL